MNRRTNNDRGVALALALIATLLVTLIAFEVAHTSRVEQFITGNYEVDSKLELACHGGLEAALARLREDRQQTEIDSKFDAWYPLFLHQDLIESDVANDEFMFGAGSDQNSGSSEHYDIQLTIQIFDEASKFNVYLLLSDDAQAARKRREMLANVIDRFRDNMDGDLSVGEGQQIADDMATFLRRTRETPYNEAPKPPTKQERTLVDLSELLYVNSITPALMWDRLDEDGRLIPGLFRFITVYGDMQMNINTASDAALGGLFTAQDVDIANRIAQYRIDHAEERERTANDVSETGSFSGEDTEEDPSGGAPFSQINELRDKVEGISQAAYNEISNFITVQSHTFTIFVTAKYGLLRRTKMYVVVRSELGWRKLYEKLVDFPYFIDPEELEGAGERALDEERERESSFSSSRR